MIKEKSMLIWLRDKLFGDPSAKPKEPVPAVEVVAAPPPAPEPVDPQITDSITAGRPPKRKYTKKTTTAKKVRK
jgi:hypothetical protein